MHRHSRTWRIAACCGLAACGVLVALWILSNQWLVRYRPVGWGAFVMAKDRIGYVHTPEALSQNSDLGDNGWAVCRAYDPIHFHWPYAVSVEFTWLLLAAAIPTAVVLYRGRGRPLHGHCWCGYDLTGNVSGICPEC